MNPPTPLLVGVLELYALHVQSASTHFHTLHVLHVQSASTHFHPLQLPVVQSASTHFSCQSSPLASTRFTARLPVRLVEARLFRALQRAVRLSPDRHQIVTRLSPDPFQIHSLFGKDPRDTRDDQATQAQYTRNKLLLLLLLSR